MTSEQQAVGPAFKQLPSLKECGSWSAVGVCEWDADMSAVLCLHSQRRMAFPSFGVLFVHRTVALGIESSGMFNIPGIQGKPLNGMHDCGSGVGGLSVGAC